MEGDATHWKNRPENCPNWWKTPWTIREVQWTLITTGKILKIWPSQQDILKTLPIKSKRFPSILAFQLLDIIHDPRNALKFSPDHWLRQELPIKQPHKGEIHHASSPHSPWFKSKNTSEKGYQIITLVLKSIRFKCALFFATMRKPLPRELV